MARITSNDLQIGYDERGSGDALVFLHGVGSDKSVWARQLAHFAPAWRAIALDYPGYGESDLPAHDLDRLSIASYIRGALDALGIAATHVVGLSMGGVIGLELALGWPERVRSLTLADSFARHPDAEAFLARSRAALETMSMREFAAARVGALLAPGAPEELRREVVETMGRIDKRTYAWASAAVWTPDYRAALRQIAAPTLVLVGEHDQITPPAFSEELASTIPGARLVVIPSAGHIANIDNPATFNLLVEEFLKNVKRKT
jgi:3-oxoadipate enol-lactonase